MNDATAVSVTPVTRRDALRAALYAPALAAGLGEWVGPQPALAQGAGAQIFADRRQQGDSVPLNIQGGRYGRVRFTELQQQQLLTRVSSASIANARSEMSLYLFDKGTMMSVIQTGAEILSTFFPFTLDALYLLPGDQRGAKATEPESAVGDTLDDVTIAAANPRVRPIDFSFVEDLFRQR